MYELLFDMYMDGDITEIYLKKAVRIGWITQEQMEKMIAFKEEANKITESKTYTSSINFLSKINSFTLCGSIRKSLLIFSSTNRMSGTYKITTFQATY